MSCSYRLQPISSLSHNNEEVDQVKKAAGEIVPGYGMKAQALLPR